MRSVLSNLLILLLAIGLMNMPGMVEGRARYSRARHSMPRTRSSRSSRGGSVRRSPYSRSIRAKQANRYYAQRSKTFGEGEGSLLQRKGIIYSNRPELRLKPQYRKSANLNATKFSPVIHDAVRYGLLPTLSVVIFGSPEAKEAPPTGIQFGWSQIMSNLKGNPPKFSLVMPWMLDLLSQRVSLKDCGSETHKCPPGYIPMLIPKGSKPKLGEDGEKKEEKSRKRKREDDDQHQPTKKKRSDDSSDDSSSEADEKPKQTKQTKKKTEVTKEKTANKKAKLSNEEEADEQPERLTNGGESRLISVGEAKK